MDALLGGGLESGSSTLILGPAGAGKSLIVFQFIAAACSRGEKAALFAFDEELGLLFRRSRAMGIDLEALANQGSLSVAQIDTAELSPGEFAHRVRAAVEKDGARNRGHRQPQRLPASHAGRELSSSCTCMSCCSILNRQGVSTFLTVAQHGLVGDMKTPVDVTYLADSVILLRFFEAEARVRRAVSVIKKRTGFHEDTIREFKISNRGLSLGGPLTGFHGVLRGVPTYRGSGEPLLRNERS